MSGVDIPRKLKDDQIHVCESCMKSVMQTFSHLYNQITELKLEKKKLEVELENLRRENEKEQDMAEQIIILKEKLAKLEKES